MYVLDPVALRELQRRIVEATHALTDTAGERLALATIPEAQLRTAALIAVQLVTGDVIWPGDRKLVVRRPRQSFGVVDLQEG